MTTQTATAVGTVYPETDGMPLPDGETQAPVYRRVVGTIEVHVRDIPGARVNGNTFIYYIEGSRGFSVSPDCYVVLNLSPEAEESIDRNNVYLLWEVGKAPDFVMEIGSKSTATTDMGRKRDLYAELGVREYWRYDPTGGEFYGEPLVGERLVDGEYRSIALHYDDGRAWSHSEVLNLDLWWDGDELRFWDTVSEKWLLSPEEEYDARLEAESRADAAETRADTEMLARLDAEARVAELEAELRRLRGE